MNGGSEPVCASDAQPTAHGFAEAADLIQPQACPLRTLRGEIRFRRIGLRLSVHARAVVTDANVHDPMALSVLSSNGKTLRRDAQDRVRWAGGTKCIACIDRQV